MTYDYKFGDRVRAIKDVWGDVEIGAEGTVVYEGPIFVEVVFDGMPAEWLGESFPMARDEIELVT